MADAASTDKDVPAFLAGPDEDSCLQVQQLRATVAQAHPGLTEHITWNAPIYMLDGEHRVTFKVNNKEGLVKLVLHMGATRPEDKEAPPVMRDDSGLAPWQSDIRAVITFSGLDDVAAQRDLVLTFVRRWLEISV